MRLLPELTIGQRRWHLPLCEPTAARLVDALLAATDDEAYAAMLRALLADPAVAAWTVCRAASDGTADIRTARAAAEWLAAHLLRALAEVNAATAQATIDARTAQQFAHRAAHALEVSAIARRLAESSSHGVEPEAAAFLGLVSQAPALLVRTQSDDDRAAGPPSAECLPAWLTAVIDSAEVSATPASPEAMMLHQALAQVSAVAHDAAGAHAVEKRWLRSHDDAAGRLYRLAARLARCGALEARFAETLEAEKLESMAEFAAGAGHEINNPLAIIAGRAQLLLRSEHDPQRRRELAMLHTQAMRVHEMIADMMLYARPPRPEFADVDVAALIAEVVGGLEPEVRLRRAHLACRGIAAPLVASGDAVQLTVALRALCCNSLAAVGQGGRVEIELRRPAMGSDSPSARSAGALRAAPHETFEIIITDDGPGIPDDVRRHLFDPFYSGRQAGRGLGLGLSKCWRIVTHHGGTIAAGGNVERGAQFVITLPVAGPPGEGIPKCA